MQDELRRVCERSVVRWRGTQMAADFRYEVEWVDGRKVGSFFASPNMIEEAVIGYLLMKGITRDVRVEEIRLSDLEYLLRITDEGELSPPRWRDEPVEWSTILSLMSDASKSIPKSICPFAFHVTGLYALKGSSVVQKMLLVDISRHTAAMKIAGWIMKRSDDLKELTPVMISTGRISGDIIKLLSLTGIRIVASMRHVLVSGAASADQRGITLISKDFTRELKVFTYPERVRGGPMVSKGGPLVRWHGKEADSPLC
ncbi:MAG: formate dehydrogenase accessory sulfurtransferase FdhD [Candidatus Korarchaeota archaeon]|nr:formate dehydrogenase accessory sulfurtransferase FdhD [Candidatus Korarchaeota archaeon]